MENPAAFMVEEPSPEDNVEDLRLLSNGEASTAALDAFPASQIDSDLARLLAASGRAREPANAGEVHEQLQLLDLLLLTNQSGESAPPKPPYRIPTRQERLEKQQKWLETRSQKKPTEQTGRPAEARAPSVATMKHRLLKGHQFPVTSIVFSPSGDLLATASRDVRLYDTSTGALKVILDGHGGLIRSIAFTPDGRLLCSGGDDCTALVWNLEHCFALCTPGTVATLTPPGGPSSTNLPTNDPKQFQGAPVHGPAPAGSRTEFRKLSVSALGLSLGLDPSAGSSVASSASVSSGYSPMSKVVQRVLKRHHKPVLTLATTPDSKYLVTGSADKTVRVWDVCTGYIMATLRGHQGEVMAVLVTPNGRRIVSTGADRTIIVWDFVTGEVKRTLKGHKGPVSCMAVAPDGYYLVTGSHDKTIRVWDLINGNELATLPAHTGPYGVLSCAVSADGTTIMSGGYDNLVKLWDAGSGLVTATLQGHRHLISGVAFNSDCNMLATAGRDDEVRLWAWSHVKAEVPEPSGPGGPAPTTHPGSGPPTSRSHRSEPPTSGSLVRSSQLEDALNNRHWAYLIGEQMIQDKEAQEEHALQRAGMGLRPNTAPSRSVSFRQL